MQIETNRYTVRLARDALDIAGAQRLRYRVFVEEMHARAAEADHDLRLESDRYDEIFDHLLLIDNDVVDPLDRVVGVYRLLTGSRARAHGGFYSGAEYDLSRIAAREAETLELGRSCVHPAHRGGIAMHLLWNGLADYVLSREIEILFGVASFPGTDADAIADGLSLLHHRHLAPRDLRVTVRPDPRSATHMDRKPDAQIDRRAAMAQIPSLIKAYLRLGGSVGEGAWIDRDFNTIDVCVLMDTTRMVDKYRDYYTRSRGFA